MMILPVFGIGIGGGGAFNFSTSESEFRNEAGVSPGGRMLAFGRTSPIAHRLSRAGSKALRRARGPQLSVDQFGFLRSPQFNSQAFIQDLLGRALARTAAQGTARGQVSPENLVSFADRSAQQVATGLLPLTQQISAELRPELCRYHQVLEDLHQPID